jgi:hypothetical protein
MSNCDRDMLSVGGTAVKKFRVEAERYAPDPQRQRH